MIKGYDLPLGLDVEIDQLQELIHKYRKGEISATELKAHRVPFGVYEQRQADTYMVRIRCAGGFITPEQLENVAAIALRYGTGDIHLTSRQELQIHYVKLDDITVIMKKLKDVGLSTRGGGGNTVRNIASQVDAGIDPQELFDVSGYMSALTTRLIAENDSWNLPRKFKIAFSGSSQDKGYATISDVGFIAKIKEGKHGFRVYAAGGLGAKSAEGKLLLDFIDTDEVYPVAKALKNVFFKYGNRRNKHAARLRFLWQNLGEEEFKKRFHEEYTIIKSQKVAPLIIPNETQAHVPARNAQKINVDKEAFSTWRVRFVREQKQQGLFSVLIPVELGFISCDRVSKLAEFLKVFGLDVLRMTKDQNFLVRNIPLDYLPEFFNFLSTTLEQVNQSSLYAKILSCAGASTCQLGICFSRQAARALMDELKKSSLDLDKVGEIKINFSGCPNSCGQHPAADLGFSGKALRNLDGLYPAYNVFAGSIISDGQTRLAEHIGEIPAKALVLLVKDFLKVFISKAADFSNFGQYFTNSGKVDLKEIILRYAKVPGFKENKNYYSDWGADAAFSLADRKAGECSAGFFDLLEMDMNNIKNTQTALEKNAQDEKLLTDLVFYSSRALLITRGLDAKSQQEVYAGFLKHFIESGLINQSFRDIVEAAGRSDSKDILVKRSQALELAKAVQALYETMDNSFNFKAALTAQELPKTKAVAVLVKDFRGVACPLNFVKTKVELSKLKPGDILEIWLDDGEPIENVPGSVKAEGHKVLEQKRLEDYWSVVIEKK